MYSNYDLYSGFSVSLNTGIYQPWLHHQNYVRNYPRYYYRNKYQGTQYTGVRGFNENSRQPVLRRTEDRNNYQPRPGEINVQNNNNPPRSGQINNQNNNNHKPENTRPPQNPAYHGKNIGEPVKVRPNMRQPKADKRIDNKKNGNAAANNHGHGK
jgi:hypothetical protein